MSERYDVYFRGDIAPGQKMGEVRQRLQALFKLDDERAAKLFSGRPLPIRRDLERRSAEQYRATLLQAGALVELRASEAGEVLADSPPVSQTAPQPARQESAGQPPERPPLATPSEGETESAAPDEGLSLAPVGADVLSPEEKVVVEAVEVDISGLDLAPAGTDLLQSDEKRVIEDLDIDLSHLSVEPIDS